MEIAFQIHHFRFQVANCVASSNHSAEFPTISKFWGSRVPKITKILERRCAAGRPLGLTAEGPAPGRAATLENLRVFFIFEGVFFLFKAIFFVFQAKKTKTMASNYIFFVLKAPPPTHKIKKTTKQHKKPKL